ncbi:hypothetical protein O181_033654 [Austropuccinia psidii MF-1]|uniref:Carboxylic ester hydrolase n=1 Tax=Austropuccinia psidii MF-1 TaxID=1389203 RepID=A0A9Q3CZJ6_9BASI|nr:hypothetical protein [Austropuccinia psidii MF-1]
MWSIVSCAAILAISWGTEGLFARFLSPKGPQVTIDYGSFIGKIEEKHNLEEFHGIPFAEPPIGKRRFANPMKPTKKYWNHDCTTYISEFGGDPDKVTIYGESSGAISVSNQLLAYGGQHNNLFRAAICQSGTALPVGRLSEGHGQQVFDYIVTVTNCSDATNKLDCLRQAPFEKILMNLVLKRLFHRAATNHFPGTFSLNAFPPTFAPAVDGEFISESIQSALKAGRFAKVPTITGDVLDEGTLLAIGALPLQSEAELRKFLIEKVAWPSDHVEKLLQLWPQNPEFGSPFGTGSKYALTPVYKQYSALLGDLGFQAMRRFFLRETSSSMPTWSYLDQGRRNFPIFGAFHASELPDLFGYVPGRRKEEYQARWIAFANNEDPNYPGLPYWSTYETDNSNLLIDKDGSKGMEPDTFRSKPMEYYLQNIDALILRIP